MFAHLEELALSYAAVMPLPIFAGLISFLEEIIAPIPSGPAMLVVGTLSQVQGYALPGLLFLTVVAVIGKLAGSLVVYAIADKAEDVLANRFARFSGITHEQIEAFGRKLSGGWKDYLLLTVLRMLPFVPSAVISAGSGVLKIRLRLFVFATFFGSLVRDAFFIYLGYAGFPAAEKLIDRLAALESQIQYAVIAGLVIALALYVIVQHNRVRLRRLKRDAARLLEK